MKRRWVVCGMMALCAAASLTAQDGWDVSVGAGVLQSAVYEGAKEIYVTPFPRVNVGYTAGGLSLSASVLDGLGISYMHRSGFLAGLSAVFGPERAEDGYSPLVTEVEHSDRTRDHLADTPSVRCPVATDLTVGAVTPIGLVGLTIGYRPTHSEGDYHAFVASALYMIGLPLAERLDLTALASIEAMDARYAEAWYSLEEDTSSLKAFEAKPGLRAAQLALELSCRLTERLGVSLLARELVLLGDAADSPFTENGFQTTAILQAYYDISFGRTR